MAICGCTTMPRVGRAVNGMTSFIQATASCIAIAVPAAVMDVRARACGVRVLKHCAVAQRHSTSAPLLLLPSPTHTRARTDRSERRGQRRHPVQSRACAPNRAAGPLRVCGPQRALLLPAALCAPPVCRDAGRADGRACGSGQRQRGGGQAGGDHCGALLCAAAAVWPARSSRGGGAGLPGEESGAPGVRWLGGGGR